MSHNIENKISEDNNLYEGKENTKKAKGRKKDKDKKLKDKGKKSLKASKRISSSLGSRDMGIGVSSCFHEGKNQKKNIKVEEQILEQAAENSKTNGSFREEEGNNLFDGYFNYIPNTLSNNNNLPNTQNSNLFNITMNPFQSFNNIKGSLGYSFENNINNFKGSLNDNNDKYNFNGSPSPLFHHHDVSNSYKSPLFNTKSIYNSFYRSSCKGNEKLVAPKVEDHIPMSNLINFILIKSK